MDSKMVPGGYRNGSWKPSRKKHKKLNLQNKKSHLLNIYGGKITTYRKLSEKVIEMLDPYLSIKKNKKWTDSKSL